MFEPGFIYLIWHLCVILVSTNTKHKQIHLNLLNFRVRVRVSRPSVVKIVYSPKSEIIPMN